MTFTEAANKQYLRNSYYVVYLCDPRGNRHRLGHTSRKSGAGLMRMLYGNKRVIELMGDELTEETTHKKTAQAIIFSNGWRLEFGGTIREEATRETTTQGA